MKPSLKKMIEALAVSAALITATAATFCEWRTVDAYVTTGSKFSTPTASYKINPNFVDASAGSQAGQITALQSGAGTWHNQAQVNFDFAYGGTTSIATVAYDGTNTVFYSGTDGGGALAVCYWWSSGGVTQQFDIEYFDRDQGSNYDFVWATSPSNSQFDIQSVAAHEFGHALGMNHSAVGTATMYPSVAPGDIGNRVLDADDVAGVRSLYTLAIPTVTQVSPSHGFVSVATNVSITGSNFTGANTSVQIGTGYATNVVVADPTHITCVIPAGSAAGPVTVQVCCNGQCGSLASGFNYDALRQLTPATRGSVATYEFKSPADAGRHYQGLASLSNSGIPLASYLDPTDTRSLPNAVDNIFIWAVNYPQGSWFINFYGTLSQTGQGWLYFGVPSAPQIAGYTFYFSVAVYNPQSKSGISFISNGISSVVQ